MESLNLAADRALANAGARHRLRGARSTPAAQSALATAPTRTGPAQARGSPTSSSFTATRRLPTAPNRPGPPAARPCSAPPVTRAGDSRFPAGAFSCPQTLDQSFPAEIGRTSNRVEAATLGSSCRSRLWWPWLCHIRRPRSRAAGSGCSPVAGALSSIVVVRPLAISRCADCRIDADRHAVFALGFTLPPDGQDRPRRERVKALQTVSLLRRPRQDSNLRPTA